MTPAGLPHSDTPGSQLGCQLPRAYRRLQRPSSALDAKASTVCPLQLAKHKHSTKTTKTHTTKTNTHTNTNPPPNPPQRRAEPRSCTVRAMLASTIHKPNNKRPTGPHTPQKGGPGPDVSEPQQCVRSTPAQPTTGRSTQHTAAVPDQQQATTRGGPTSTTPLSEHHHQPAGRTPAAPPTTWGVRAP